MTDFCKSHQHRNVVVVVHLMIFFLNFAWCQCTIACGVKNPYSNRIQSTNYINTITETDTYIDQIYFKPCSFRFRVIVYGSLPDMKTFFNFIHILHLTLCKHTTTDDGAQSTPRTVKDFEKNFVASNLKNFRLILFGSCSCLPN